MTNHPNRSRHAIRNRFASISRPEGRDLLERTVRDGRVVWVESENPVIVVADGRNVSEADAALRFVYSDPAWDLRIGKRGAWKMPISGGHATLFSS